MMASLIAGIGLGTNSATVVVSSMLVSSMMEPIKGMTTAFNSAICCNFHQCLRFWKHSGQLLLDTLICIAFGAFIGHVSIGTASTTGYTITEDLCDNNDWVRTENDTRVKLPAEMSSRTKVLGLAISAVVACASAVALAIADKTQNKSALVGIGISASLLPPAVNCGMLFVFDGCPLIEYYESQNK